MSPLGSKEPNESFVSPRTVVVASKPQKSACLAYGPPPQWPPARTNATGMAAANGAKKFSKFPVLADRRPGGLDEFASQPGVSTMGDRSPMGFLSRRALAGNQSQKPCQLAHVLKLPPVADAGQSAPGPHRRLAGADWPQSSQSHRHSSYTQCTATAQGRCGKTGEFLYSPSPPASQKTPPGPAIGRA